MELDSTDDVFLQDDLGPTLAEHALQCNQIFKECIAAPKTTMDPTLLDDQLARFTLWTSNMDVFGPPNVSLDYRLRYSPTVVDIIHQLLNVVYNALKKLLKPSDNQLETTTKKKRRTSGSGRAEGTHTVDYSSDIDSGGDQVERNISLITYTIGGTVSQLFRMSNAVGRAAKAARAAKITKYKNDEKVNNAISELRLDTESYVRFRFPHAAEALRSTLVEANALRFRRLCYQRAHRRRVALSAQHRQADTVTVQLPNLLLSAPAIHSPSNTLPKPGAVDESWQFTGDSPASTTHETTAQQTAVRAVYDSPMTGVLRTKSVAVNSTLSLPPAPNTGECPYCGVILEFNAARNPILWKNHVITDLEPFVCLFVRCAELTFDTSKAWVSHMQTAHGHVWECRAPSHELVTFKHESEFQEHSRTEHAVPETYVGTLSDAARRPVFQKIVDCPFGDDFTTSERAGSNTAFASDALQQHVTTHMKEIALLALQKLPSDDHNSEKISSDILSENDGVVKLAQTSQGLTRAISRNGGNTPALNTEPRDASATMSNTRNDDKIHQYIVSTVKDWDRYNKGNEYPVLFRAKETLEAAGRLINQTHKDYLCFLEIYGQVHISLFDAGSTATFDSAIKYFNENTAMVDTDPELLQLHGALYLRRFKWRADTSDLERGIAKEEGVLRLADATVDNKLFALTGLAECKPLLCDFGIGDANAHLESAVKHGRDAMDLAQRERDDTAGTAFVYGALAYALYRRYQYAQNLTEIKDAIEMGNIAVSRAEDKDLDKPKWENNLGLAYIARFRSSPDQSDLLKAISWFEKATSRDRTYSKALSNLADAQGLRFEWTGETEALDLAVTKYRSLVESTQQEVVDHADYMQNLGNILLYAYGRHLMPGFLDEAIAALEKALKAYPEDHEDASVTRSVLCNALVSRYRYTHQDERTLPDIDNAIKHGEASLSPIVNDHPQRARLLHMLSMAYFVKWDGTGRVEQEILDKAVCLSTDGLSCKLHLATDEASYMVHHANLLLARIFSYNPDCSLSTFDQPLQSLVAAVYLDNGLPLVRITAARKAIRILGKQDKWEDARGIGLVAIKLLPLVCSRHLSLVDQQQAISHTSGLAAEVCSILLKLGENEEALKQLEASRAMLLGFALDSSEELSALKGSAEHKDLLEQFTDMVEKLRIPPHLQGLHLGEVKMRERRLAETQFSKLIDEIRSIDGHRDFLSSVSVDSMKSCCKDGAIVLVNMSYIGSHAIILFDTELHLVPLPELEWEHVVDFGIQLISGFSLVDFPVQRAAKVLSRRAPKGTQAAQPDLLHWLWRFCVLPIFGKLGVCRTRTERAELQRIWWIGSGAAAGFPFHAAASASEPGEDVLSLTLSSYAPSVKVLLNSKRNSDRLRGELISFREKKLSVTIITMETTPEGHIELPGVSREKEVIEGIVSSKSSFTWLGQPTASRTLEAMLKSNIVHVACHGVSNRGDPSQSHFVLERLSEDGNTKVIDKLTVSQLLAIKSTQNAWIAFLSACSTSTMSTFRLGDEGLHLSGALLVAGFPHVVGSLWKVEDNIAVDIAGYFYEALFSSEGLLGDSNVAAALRKAVMRVREQHPNPESWRKWAAYIHLGT